MKGDYKNQSKGELTRVGSHFIKDIKDIQKERLDEGVDKKKKSIKFLTDKIIKHSYWIGLRKALISEKFKEEKNG